MDAIHRVLFLPRFVPAPSTLGPGALHVAFV